MKIIVKYLLFFLTAVLPLKKNRIFTTLMDKSNSSGPNRFMFNLEQYLNSKNIKVERIFLGRANSVLIFSTAPFKDFYNICKKRNIKTVLRVDGFYVPSVFNGIETENRQKRELDEDKLFINQGMQHGILRTDWVIYQSKFSKEMADKYLCQRNDKYSIIYNGVNTKHFKPMNIKKGDTKTIMLLGSWRDEDLLLCSLRAFSLFQEINKNSSLHILGKVPQQIKENIDKWIVENSLKESIQFIGKVSYEELPIEINKCDVSLHIKSGDWCPNAVLETMACGVPVICQEYGATKELVGSKSLVIPHKEFYYDEELSIKTKEKLNLVFNDLKSYKVDSRQRIEDDFTLEKSASDYFKILN